MDSLVREAFLVLVRLWCSYRVCVSVSHARLHSSGVISDSSSPAPSSGAWEVSIMLVEFVLNEFT